MNLDNYCAVYLYGSRVYGNYREDSDYDHYVIQDGIEESEVVDGNINMKLMSPEHFQYLLDIHYISALECYFLPENYVLKAPTFRWRFELNLSTLRHSLSKRSNISYAKARKKFLSPYDWATDEIMRGKKSLFHAFRILDFGIQIAEYGRIIDYSSANHIYYEIMSLESLNWLDYEAVWKAPYNKLCTDFRKIAPKD